MLDPGSASQATSRVADAMAGVPVQPPVSQSASGTTWSAFDAAEPMSGMVTVKRYNARFTEYLMRNRVALERLCRFEGRTVPGLPRLVRAGIAAGQLTMLAEGIRGESLDQVLARNRRGLAPGLASALIGQLARALDAMHRGGLLHGDVRPASILVDLRDGQAVFIDWGHAIPVGGLDAHAIPAIALDAAPYTSAELLAAMAPEPADDVFALAVVAYEILSGTHPFARRTAADAQTMGLVAAPLVGIDSRINAALMSALSLDRGTRRISMRELGAAFNRTTRFCGIAALNAVLNVAADGSFARGTAVGIAVGAAITVAASLLVRSGEVALNDVAAVPHMAIGQPSGEAATAPDMSSHQTPAVFTANDQALGAYHDSIAVESETHLSHANQTIAPAALETGQGDDVARRSPSLNEEGDAARQLAQSVLARPGPITDDRTALVTKKLSTEVNKQAAPAKSSERFGNALPGRSAKAQVSDACPRCSCAGLREKRFIEGKALSWDEASFVLNECGGS